jgi:WD40 repeat protein
MTIEEALKIIDRSLQPKSLTDAQELVFRESWVGQSYAEMAKVYGYSEDYLKDVGSKLWKLLSQTLQQEVRKTNLQVVMRHKIQEEDDFISPVATTIALDSPESINSTSNPQIALPTPFQCCQVDWGEAMEVYSFFGRAEELERLQTWTITERCRLIAILGMGGMGKSTLVVKLAELLSDRQEFKFIIWRSLRNAPRIEALLADIIQVLSGQTETEVSLPQDFGSRLARFMHYLRQYRCLLILDNGETILQGGTRVGHYREGYEGYGELWRQVGELRHQSCLILTSREKPQEIALLEGDNLPVRSRLLPGLNVAEGQALIAETGAIAQSPADWSTLVQHFAGNPLALKIVAVAIEDLFGGSLSEFLAYSQQNQISLVFDDIRHLLDRQFSRLSQLEQEIMYWLAINREFVSLYDLQADLVSSTSQRYLSETLSFLRRRSLLETQMLSFTQQPVVMEYVTEKLIGMIVEEIATGEINLLMSHALIKANAKDYLQDSQFRAIVEPILAFLANKYPNQSEKLLNRILAQLHEEYAHVPGYGAGNIINLLRSLGTDLTGYDFSNLAIWQANLQNLRLHHVNLENADVSKSVFSDTLGGIFKIAFSHDGKLLALGDSDGEIRLWQVSDASDRQLLSSWRGHEGVMSGMAFSPDDQMLVTASRHIIKLWGIDSALGQCLQTWSDHLGWIRYVDFSPDGRLIASAGNEDETLRIWEVETGVCRHVLPNPGGSVLTCTFHPTQAIVATGHGNCTTKLWNAETGECLTTLVGQSNQIWSIAFSPDGEILATADAGGTIKLWHLTTGECYATATGHIGIIYNLAISPDGATLASAASDSTIRVWNLATGQCLRALLGHTNSVFTLAFHPGDGTLVTGSFDRTVKFWDYQTGQCLNTWRGYSNGVCAIAMLPNSTLASGYHDGLIRLWNLPTGECTQTLAGHEDFVWTVAVSASGKLIATSGEDRLIKLWNIETGQCYKILRGHLSTVTALAFSFTNPTILVSASYDSTLKVWDLATGSCLHTLQGHLSWIWDIAFHPNGQIFASASFDHTIRLWDYQQRQSLQVLTDHTHWVWGVAFTTDGKNLASASGDRTIKIWDVATGKCLRTLEGHSSWVLTVAYSPDNQYIASGSADNTVKIWDAATGNCLHTLEGHVNWVWSVVFDENGQTVISGCQDETIQVWDVQTGERLRILKGNRLYEQMNLTGVTGLTKSQQYALQVLGAISQ